jgi:hypothetical protein
MLYHRTLEPVIVQSREEEDALGSEWARTVWPAEPPVAEPPDAPAEPEQRKVRKRT